MNLRKIIISKNLYFSFQYSEVSLIDWNSFYHQSCKRSVTNGKPKFNRLWKKAKNIESWLWKTQPVIKNWLLLFIQRLTSFSSLKVNITNYTTFWHLNCSFFEFGRVIGLIGSKTLAIVPNPCQKRIEELLKWVENLLHELIPLESLSFKVRIAGI